VAKRKLIDVTEQRQLNVAFRDIKGWQAIMDHLRSLPVKTKGELPVIPVDARAAEVRSIKVD